MQPISFCINTSKNEKDHLILLMQSLMNGIDVNLHQVMVFVDSDNQGSKDFLESLRPEFPGLFIIQNKGEPVGYAGNINYMFYKAKHDIVSYLQSDMVVSLNYDEKVLRHLTDNRIICSTRCEPPLHCPNDNIVTFVRPFGYTPDQFQYEEFLKFAEAHKDPYKLTDYFFAPFTLYKKLWNEIGGHDVSFKKSREDSDIALRLALNNIELKQSWEAIVWHFTCTSSRGIEWWKSENQQKNEATRQANDQIELKRFVDKWGNFVHVCHPSQAQGFDKSKIVVKNPPIDETKLTIL